MKKSTNKDNYSKQEKLGQYNTHIDYTDIVIKNLPDIVNENTLFIEPSFGCGNFIKSIRKRFNNAIVGVEIDSELLFNAENLTNCDIFNKNFYDFEYGMGNYDNVIFIGNPPYRTPAISLKERPEEIKRLKSKYDIGGIKEECVFFIVKTFDLLKQNGKDGDIFYILPKTIFQNPTKAFKTLYNFFNEQLNIVSIKDVDNTYFENVSQSIVLVHFTTKKTNSNTILYNNEEILLKDFIGENSDIIPFNRIFKKTYLGSVPAESFLMSCKNEPKESFYERIVSIFFEETNVNNLLEKLTYNGNYHLSKIDDKKLNIIIEYINEIKNNYDISIFKNIDNYKPIKHRNEWRYYFRHDSLKKVSFVYIIHSNPCESFYFTSNPTSISTDYYGYTDYDVNRNSSPGTIRTVPINSMEDNITDSFKDYWCNNTERPITDIFEYFIHIYNSDWYKTIKKTYSKFYFGVPKVFMDDFNKKK
jgi:hypothetical protein